MNYSVEFKRAVAAAAITRLIQGRRNLDMAARYVIECIGHKVFVTLHNERKIEALREYRKRLMEISYDKPSPPRLTIARFHYDSCLKWIEEQNLKPEKSAALLMATLLSTDQ